jgi:hypothetical protein
MIPQTFEVDILPVTEDLKGNLKSLKPGFKFNVPFNLPRKFLVKISSVNNSGKL